MAAAMLSRTLELFHCYAAVRHNRDSKPADVVDFCFRQTIKPLQVRSEFLELATIIDNVKPRYALEIGTASGGSLFTLCRLADPHATVISIDLYMAKFGGGYHWTKKPLYKSFAQRKQKVHLLRADSHARSTLEKVKSIIGDNKLDYFLIDGDHTYEGVRSDFEMYSPLVRPGGVILFHDIAEHKTIEDCQVSRFWREIKNSFQHREIIADPQQGWAGIGLLTAN